MKTKAIVLSGVVLIILLLGSLSPAVALAKSDEYKAKVVSKETGKKVGKATLKIKGDTLNVKLSTTGLETKHVFSVWGQVNNEKPFNLTGFSTSGKKSNKNGSGNFKVKVKIKGPITQFKLTLKDHGPPIKGKVDLQKSTKDFGCPGPGSCPSVQTATFNDLNANDNEKKKRN